MGKCKWHLTRVYCTPVPDTQILSMRYLVTFKVHSGYHAIRETGHSSSCLYRKIPHELQLVNCRPYRRTNHALSITYIHIYHPGKIIKTLMTCISGSLCFCDSSKKICSLTHTCFTISLIGKAHSFQLFTAV